MHALSHLRLALLALIAVLALALPAAAQTFPPLSGRVVDAAGVLDAGVRAMLTEKLAAYEAKTSNQVVVATVGSLQGLPIEVYANRLFRTWRLGQEDRNNGVLLLVAPADHKVRIEVGYGLEGALPDAVAKLIIEDVMLPQLRVGRIDAAITAGVETIADVISGRDTELTQAMQARANPNHVEWPYPWWTLLLPFIIFPPLLFLYGIYFDNAVPEPASGPRGSSRDRDRGRSSDSSSSNWSSSSSSSSSSNSSSSPSSSSSSDSFSGGGGSSGGGGASGSW